MKNKMKRLTMIPLMALVSSSVFAAEQQSISFLPMDLHPNLEISARPLVKLTKEQVTGAFTVRFQSSNKILYADLLCAGLNKGYIFGNFYQPFQSTLVSRDKPNFKKIKDVSPASRTMRPPQTDLYQCYIEFNLKKNRGVTYKKLNTEYPQLIIRFPAD